MWPPTAIIAPGEGAAMLRDAVASQGRPDVKVNDL